MNILDDNFDYTIQSSKSEIEMSKKTSFFQGRERAALKQKITDKENNKKEEANKTVEILREANKKY